MPGRKTNSAEIVKNGTRMAKYIADSKKCYEQVKVKYLIKDKNVAAEIGQSEVVIDVSTENNTYPLLTLFQVDQKNCVSYLKKKKKSFFVAKTFFFFFFATLGTRVTRTSLLPTRSHKLRCRVK